MPKSNIKTDVNLRKLLSTVENKIKTKKQKQQIPVNMYCKAPLKTYKNNIKQCMNLVWE